MNLFWKITILCIVAAATAGVIVLKNHQASEGGPTSCCAGGAATPEETSPEETPPEETSPEAKPQTPRPRLVDLGQKTCVPCKAMAPILDELKTEYAGRIDVVFIDVSEDDSAVDG